MAPKLAVAVIHGMGHQQKDDPDDSAALSFSSGLHRRLSRIIGPSKFQSEIAWREIYWAPILQDRQDAYMEATRTKTDWAPVRRFVLSRLSDAASYRLVPSDKNDTAYGRIHARASRVMAELRADMGRDGPVLVLAHSLGGHIMSNYIYDAHKAAFKGQGAPTATERMQTVALFVTFGCNIPVFTFAYAPEDVHEIRDPNTELPEGQRFHPWWLNYYDRDDVLGYPLADTSPHYLQMAQDNRLQDIQVNVGNILTSWNPLSHNAYWTDPNFVEPLVHVIRRFL